MNVQLYGSCKQTLHLFSRRRNNNLSTSSFFHVVIKLSRLWRLATSVSSAAVMAWDVPLVALALAFALALDFLGIFDRCVYKLYYKMHMNMK